MGRPSDKNSAEVAPRVAPRSRVPLNWKGRRPALVATALLALIAVLGACVRDDPPPTEPFSFLIDPTIEPNQQTILRPGGESPVVALQDEVGRQYDFIGNEVVILPNGQAQLDQFLARRSGEVVADYQEEGAERTVVVRLDASEFPLDRLVEDAERARIPGEHRFNSEQAARLMALILRERATGLRVASDGLHRADQAVMLRAMDANNINAMSQPFFDGPSGGNVVQAWQYLAALRLNGPLPRVPVAIIDGGFQVDGGGASVPDTNGNSDLPAQPLQWDYVHNSSVISGTNAARCSGGSQCPWHGHGSASVATAIIDNGAYAAGTGGMVADAILLNVDLSLSQVKAAIDRARALGARVINLSFGGACGTWCSLEKDVAGYYNAFERARGSDILIVAAAGNDGDNVADVDTEPCTIEGVLCVGALGSVDAGDNHVWDTQRRSYSNHGPGVDIYAPTFIWSWYGRGAFPQLDWMGGTSASSPFVAGIAAMVRSANPGMSARQVVDALLSTARTDSPHVPRYVDAYAAVRAATSSLLPLDRFEPNGGAAVATTLTPGAQNELTISSVNDIDFYRVALSSPSMVGIDLAYPDRIGRMGLPPFARENSLACGLIEQDSYVRTRDGLTASYRVPNGNFVFGANSPGNPLPYNLSLSRTALTFPADGYEPNNSLATARSLGDGGYIAANLHSASDEDYYTVYSYGAFSTMFLSMYSRVIVENSDIPLTIRLYNSSDVLIGTAQADATCSQPVSLNMPVGVHKVRVTGPGPGSYRLFLGTYAEQHPVIDLEAIFTLILHPDIPISFAVRQPEVWYLVHHLSEGAPSAMKLEGAGLHLTLYDEAGETLLGEGVPQSDFEGEILTLSGGDPTAVSFMLRVSRTFEALEGGELPLIPAQLTSY